MRHNYHEAEFLDAVLGIFARLPWNSLHLIPSEWISRNTRLRVGNLMPGEAATVWLDLSGPISFADGEATFRFPLVVAPRYVPGVPLERTQVGNGTVPDTDAVPDASRITPAVLLPGSEPGAIIPCNGNRSAARGV